MEIIRKEDVYCRYFVGSNYHFENIRTIGNLKSALEEIIEDLPKDSGLEISDFYMKDHELYYVLKEGIVE